MILDIPIWYQQFLYWCISPQNSILTGTTTQIQKVPGRNSNEGRILHTLVL